METYIEPWCYISDDVDQDNESDYYLDMQLING